MDSSQFQLHPLDCPFWSAIRLTLSRLRDTGDPSHSSKYHLVTAFEMVRDPPRPVEVCVAWLSFISCIEVLALFWDEAGHIRASIHMSGDGGEVCPACSDEATPNSNFETHLAGNIWAKG